MQISQNLVRKQIMLSPANIKKLESIARSKKKSVAEIVRIAVDSYDPTDWHAKDERLLAELIEVVNASTQKAEAALSKGLLDVENALKDLNNGNH